MRIGIIGSAGRQEDKRFVTPVNFKKMIDLAEQEIPDGSTLVSGGAAFADHIAVVLFCQQMKICELELHLPAPFENGRYVEEGFQSPGNTANYYHKLFSKALGIKSLVQLEIAIQSDAVTKTYSGFRERNLEVGKVDLLLAFTRGVKEPPTSGGTRHIWNHSKARKIHFSLNNL